MKIGGKTMSDVSNTQPSWKKFVNHPGPSELELHEALQEWNRKKVGMGNRSAGNRQGGGRLMFGTPRKGKCRDLKVNGLRLK